MGGGKVCSFLGGGGHIHDANKQVALCRTCKILIISNSDGELSLYSLKLIVIRLIQDFEADFLKKLSVKILNSEIIL